MKPPSIVGAFWLAAMAAGVPNAAAQSPCQSGTQVGAVTYSSAQTVAALNYVLANGALTANPGVNVVFQAEQEICFEPGFSFSAPQGGSLSAVIGVPPAPSVYGPSSLPYGVQGQPYGPVTLIGSGGTGNYSWSLAGLPAGITISATGVISGTPAAGSSLFFSPVVTVTDSLTGLTGTRTWNNDAILSVVPISLNFGPSSVATPISVGAPPGVAWSAVSTNTSWLTASGSGTGSGGITVGVGANSGSSTRTAYVTLSIAGGIAGSFVVQQAGSGSPLV